MTFTKWDEYHDFTRIPLRLVKGTCECVDRGCPHCHGDCREAAYDRLYRVDQVDETGTLMCPACAMDALLSGVFTLKSE